MQCVATRLCCLHLRVEIDERRPTDDMDSEHIADSDEQTLSRRGQLWLVRCDSLNLH
jgi:hypothetical protein